MITAFLRRIAPWLTALALAVVSDRQVARADEPDAGALWPEARSPAPSATDWQRADDLVLARNASGCKARRLREWIRIACSASEVDLVGGSHQGVDLHETKADGAVAIFPVRRGDRRVIQFIGVAGGDKYTVELDVDEIVSELWLAGDPGPTIVVH